MTEQLNIASIIVSQRGSKTAALLNGKERYFVTFEQPCQCLFPPSNFDKDESATRMSVHFELNEELEQFFNEFDTWAKGYLQQHSERIFGKQLSEQQVEASYCSCVKSGKGVKLKINMASSPRPARFWNADGSERGFPDDWATSFALKIKVSHLWILGSKEKQNLDS